MFKFWKSKRMSFRQAKRELEKLANGDYHVLGYKITDFGDDRDNVKLEQECSVYVNGFDYYYGATWRIALDKLETAMTGVSLPVKIDDIPDKEIENED